MQIQLATLSALKTLVVCFLRDLEEAILSPVGVVAVVAVHSVSIALHFAVGTLEQEFVVLTLIQLRHLLEHLLIVQNGLRDVPTGTRAYGALERRETPVGRAILETLDTGSLRSLQSLLPFLHRADSTPRPSLLLGGLGLLLLPIDH